MRLQYSQGTAREKIEESGALFGKTQEAALLCKFLRIQRQLITPSTWLDLWHPTTFTGAVGNLAWGPRGSATDPTFKRLLPKLLSV